MTETHERTSPPESSPPAARRALLGRVLRLMAAGVWFGALILAGFFGWRWFAAPSPMALSSAPAAALPATTAIPPSATPSPTATVTPSPPPAPATVPALPPARLVTRDSMIVSIDEGVASHLFLFDPQNGQLLRLTSGEWRDIHPALSPDGSSLAFASNRSGVWDLYLLDLTSGAIQRLTATSEYDASPSWSPDGLWLAYESYVAKADAGDLEIFIRPLDGSQDPIRLTDDPAADHSPDWSPQGRRIAFISTRTGNAEVWIADLDVVDGRYVNASRSTDAGEAHPAWAPDGERLAWASSGADGVQSLMVWNQSTPELRPEVASSGAWPVWSTDGQALLTAVLTPNRTYLTGYSLQGDGLTLPLRALPGGMNGAVSGAIRLADPLQGELAAAQSADPTPLWIPLQQATAALPGGRVSVAPLAGMDGDDYLLHDGVDDSFYALRARVARLAGWDFLSTLEGAFIPLTAPPSPGMGEDWLYTGRAFRFSTAPANAGWLALVREDYGAQTYWRVYIRARFQDGEQGAPLHELPWDLAARHSGEVVAYEQGGRPAPAPPGYWVDFTRVASAYGWERLPALSSWRGAFSGVRYNEFVLRSGLDWISAMLEIYPKAALDTPTPVSSPTMTSTASNTPIPSPTYTRTPYRSRTPTPTNTRRPTRTPTPTATRWPTRTPTPTDTLRPTRTPTPGSATPPAVNP